MLRPILLSLALATVHGPTCAAPRLQTLMKGLHGGGSCRAVQVLDSLALISNGPYLRVLDCSDETSPRSIGLLKMPDEILDIQVADQIAWLAHSYEGISAVSLADPRHPVILRTSRSWGQANALILRDEYLYVADGLSGLRIVPWEGLLERRTQGWFWNTPGNAVSLALEGSRAYVADSDGGVQLLDIQDPSNIIWIAGLLDSLSIARVAVKDSILYAVETRNQSRTHVTLHVLDVRDPDTPHELDIRSVFSDTDGNLALQNNTLYLASGWGGLSMLDISDPAEIPYQSHFSDPDGCVDVSPKSYLAYLACGKSGFRIADLILPGYEFVAGRYSTPVEPMKIVQRDGLAWVADRHEGLTLFDVRDPLDPRELSWINLTDGIVDFAVTDSFLYALSGGRSLRIYTNDTPGVNEQTGYFQYGTNILSLAVTGDLVCLLSRNALRFLDTSDQLHPLEIGLWSTTLDLKYMAVEDSLAYLVSATKGVLVVDFHDPRTPIPVGGWCPDIGELAPIDVRGNTAYVMSSPHTLNILDVSDPGAITLLSATDSLSMRGRIHPADSVLFYQCIFSGYGALDIRDPEHPVPLGETEPGRRWTVDLAVEGRTITSIESGVGLVIDEWAILDVADPEDPEDPETPQQFTLPRNAPNPFNAGTRISWTLPVSSRVELTVFDLGGRRVRHQDLGRMVQGQHEYRLVADDLPSGVLFYRIVTEQETHWGKMLHLK
ncbi:MAG: hypothetical protein H6678_10705 [Candidatus Delongbacteria bacterium]|nr:hypothetical protein [Candidatus Delongbacteria bacterium]